MTPAYFPDPRIDRYPRCEDGARWQLNIGGEGWTSRDSAPPPVYLEPDGEPISEVDLYSFEVIEGPICINGVAWWGIHLQTLAIQGEMQLDESVMYWIEEAQSESTNNGFLYNVFPVSRTNTDCSDTLRSYFLPIGQPAYVLAGRGANNVRSQPSLSGELMGSIPEGAVFDILDGPVCADNIIWWRVNYKRLLGWTAGGDSEARFVNDYYSEFLYNYISR
jgi:hypothetical protein